MLNSVAECRQKRYLGREDLILELLLLDSEWIGERYLFDFLLSCLIYREG